MTGTFVEGVRISDNRKIIISATREALVTPPIEVRDLINYTFTCSTLGMGEEIGLDIYDFSRPTPAWQPYMLNGGRVKLTKDFEQIQLSSSSITIRFNKPNTVNPVGLVMSTR